jgi:glycosyltransferase involved in cell wall biosynthesis
MARADFPAFAHKIGVIYNGIEAPIKETIVKSDLTRFLFVGRLVPHKRLDVVLRALADTPGEWRLDVLGDGPMRHGLETLTLQLGLEDRVAYHGWLSAEEVYAAMRASHWLVLPSLTEGLSMAGLQACSLGVPLIGADAPGLRGFIEPDVTGLLVNGGEDVWRETLTAAVEHPELWERLSSHCADHD